MNLTLSEFIDRLAGELGMRAKELELYARWLREAKMLPDRTGGRKVAIGPNDAAVLVIAVIAAPYAAQSALAAANYVDLRRIDTEESGTILPGVRNLRALVAAALRPHDDKADADFFKTGLIEITRGVPVAQFRSGRIRLSFQHFGSGPHARGPLAVTASLGTDVLVRLSDAMASTATGPHRKTKRRAAK
jgi:hypothetical protein